MHLQRFVVLTVVAVAMAMPMPMATAQAPLLGWTLPCLPGKLAWVDPIVVPGGQSAHGHQFVGRHVAADSTYDSLRASNSVGCGEFTDDKSGYWIPVLRDRNGVLAPIRRFNVYVTVRGGMDPQSVQPWPVGLKMVVGSGAAGGPQPPRISWACMGTAINVIGPADDLPRDCPDDLPQNRAKVVFPDCSNGEVDSPDHISHLAYSEGGACPETHPTPIPGLSFGVIYDLRDGEGAFLSSNHQSPRAAYGMHGDFFDGWSTEEVRYLIDNCIKDGTGCGARRPAVSDSAPTR